VHRSTITRAAGEVRPLLAARGFAVPGQPGLRLKTLADVFACAAARGVKLRIDGTEVQVRRPRPGWPGRRAFVSGKKKQNTIKSTAISDGQGRLLWLGAWQATLFLGVVMLIPGPIVSFHPSGSLNGIAVLLGILLIVGGIFHLIRMFNTTERHRVWLGISGLLLIVIGVILIRHLHLTVALIGLVVGVSWIVQGPVRADQRPFRWLA